MRSCQAPLFENLVGGSTAPPPLPAERKGGCTLCSRRLSKLQTHVYLILLYIDLEPDLSIKRFLFDVMFYLISNLIWHHWDYPHNLPEEHLFEKSSPLKLFLKSTKTTFNIKSNIEIPISVSPHAVSSLLVKLLST